MENCDVMPRTLIIGDIHGRLKKLMRALEYAEFNESVDRLIGLGDYIDRGRESAQVLDYLVGRTKRYPGRDIYLRGNHEEAIVMALQGTVVSLAGWLESFDGFSALRSYGIEPERIARAGDTYIFDRIQLKTPEANIRALRKIFPPDHLEFLARTKYCTRLDRWFLCHAGLRLGARIEEHKDFELVWGDRKWLEATREELRKSPFQPPVIAGHWHGRLRPVTVAYKRIIVSSEWEVPILIYEEMAVVDSLGDRIEIKPEWYDDAKETSGKCGARLFIRDDHGSDKATIRCKLPCGHEGVHEERSERTDPAEAGRVLIQWERDEGV